MQLPQTFLAKVDPTAAKSLIKIDKQGLPESARYNRNGDIEVSIVTQAGARTNIYLAEKNGTPISLDNIFTVISGNTVTIRMREIPIPVGGSDVYRIYVSEDGKRPTTHIVKFSVVRS